MEIGWTEETCSHIDALALEDHSSVALRAERVRPENTWRINLNGQGSNTAPPRQRKSLQKFVRRKRKPLLLDKFLTPTFRRAQKSAALEATILAIRENWAQIIEARRDLLRDL